MGSTKFFIYVLLLLFFSCHFLCADANEPPQELRARGSGSRSPSPSRSTGKAPMQAAPSTGLLDDIVKHVVARPATSTHASHSTEGHSLQATPGHTHPHALSTPTHQTQSTPPTHTHPHHYVSHSQPPSLPRLPRLGHLAAQLQPAPTKEGPRKRPKPKRLPPGVKAPPRSDKGTGKGKATGRGTWWKKSGGTPVVRQGASSRYESNKKYRENKKLREQGLHTDEHPSAHPPHGGGPGSPGAGSHAVSRKRHLGEQD